MNPAAFSLVAFFFYLVHSVLAIVSGSGKCFLHAQGWKHMPTLRAPFWPHFELHLVGELLSRLLALITELSYFMFGTKAIKGKALAGQWQDPWSSGSGLLTSLLTYFISVKAFPACWLSLNSVHAPGLDRKTEKGLAEIECCCRILIGSVQIGSFPLELFHALWCYMSLCSNTRLDSCLCKEAGMKFLSLSLFSPLHLVFPAHWLFLFKLFFELWIIWGYTE